MKIYTSHALLSFTLSAIVMSASAQKTYSEGIVTYKTNLGGQDVEVKEYFRPDSSAAS